MVLCAVPQMPATNDARCDEIVLCAEDYPESFVNGSHPEDHAVCNKPIEPQHLYHHVRGRHNRLWLRVSWQTPDGNSYVNLSFMLDTGAPKHMYLSEPTMRVVEALGLVHVDEDVDIQYVRLFGRKCSVDPTPRAHAPANIIGLKLLKQLGLTLMPGPPHFCFANNLTFFSPEATAGAT